jgi:hypothetical protein
MLNQVLAPHGFRFVENVSGVGSGGEFATGEFRRGNRRLELHFRGSLGLVSYHVGSDDLAHRDYVRAVRETQGIKDEAEYPGFSDDPLDGFRHLCADLVRFGAAFTAHSGEFAGLAAWTRQHPPPKGLAALQ